MPSRSTRAAAPDRRAADASDRSHPVLSSISTTCIRSSAPNLGGTDCCGPGTAIVGPIDELQPTQICMPSTARRSGECAQHVWRQRRFGPVVVDNPTAIGVAIDPLAALPFGEAEAVLFQGSNDAPGWRRSGAVPPPADRSSDGDADQRLVRDVARGALGISAPARSTSREVGLDGVIEIAQGLLLGGTPSRATRQQWYAGAPAAVVLLDQLGSKDIGLHGFGGLHRRRSTPRGRSR